MIRAIVGANWGDEGKGKITDALAKDADVVVRFQGGSNAGHTIVNQYGRFALHQLPSGVFYDHTTNIIGNGVALDLGKFLKETESLAAAGVRPKLLVSDRVQVVMPYHVLFDEYEEARLAGKSFGSTKSGIAPFYSDKYAKTGFQLCELYDEDYCMEKLERVLAAKNVILKYLYNKPELSAREIFEQMRPLRDAVAPYMADTFQFLRQARAEGKTILLEGQLGSMKDPDHGIYPMVTSSSTLAGYGAVGAGLPPYEIQDIICVVKAYSSAVGAGAFVSEIFGDEAQALRLHGGDKGEFGATTGRPRRMGWFDCVATRYGVETQGATVIALTKLDVLSYMDEIPICSQYELFGEKTDRFPFPTVLADAKPIVTHMPGWKCDISKCRSWEELPIEARNYVEYVEREIGCRIGYVSVGPERESIIIR